MLCREVQPRVEQVPVRQLVRPHRRAPSVAKLAGGAHVVEVPVREQDRVDLPAAFARGRQEETWLGARVDEHAATRLAVDHEVAEGGEDAPRQQRVDLDRHQNEHPSGPHAMPCAAPSASDSPCALSSTRAISSGG